MTLSLYEISWQTTSPTVLDTFGQKDVDLSAFQSTLYARYSANLNDYITRFLASIGISELAFGGLKWHAASIIFVFFDFGKLQSFEDDNVDKFKSIILRSEADTPYIDLLNLSKNPSTNQGVSKIIDWLISNKLAFEQNNRLYFNSSVYDLSRISKLI
jgi:tRNA isopentenyl-2-thiomethyl-A-37 hydroxylase MiaE